MKQEFENNKRRTAAIKRAQSEKQERRREYEQSKFDAKKIFLIIFAGTFLLMFTAFLVTLLTNTIYINNSQISSSDPNYPKENWVSAMRLLDALFSANWTRAVDPATGGEDWLQSYYYWVETQEQTGLMNAAAVLTLITVVVTALTALVSGGALALAAAKKEYLLTYFTLAFSAVSFVLLLSLYIVVFRIYDIMYLDYCMENPNCSMGSDVLWPLLLSAAALAGNVFAVIKFRALEKKRKAIAG